MVRRGEGQGSSRQREKLFPNAGEIVIGSKEHRWMLEVITGESREAEKGQIEKDLAWYVKHFVFYP